MTQEEVENLQIFSQTAIDVMVNNLAATLAISRGAALAILKLLPIVVNVDQPIKGNYRVIDIGNPAAGVEYTTQTVPTGKYWVLRAFKGVITTGVTANDRFFYIGFTDGTNEFCRAGQGGKFQQSQTGVSFAGYIGAGFMYNNETLHSARLNPNTIPLPNFLLPAGYTITFNTINLAGTDDWGQGYILIEEYG